MTFRRYAAERTAFALAGFFLALCAIAVIFRVLPWPVGRRDVELRRQISDHARGSFPEDVAGLISRVLHGDLGTSFSGGDVSARVASALPVSTAVVIGAIALAMAAAIVASLSPSRTLLRWISYFALGTSTLWIGLMLAYALGFRLGWTPITGYCDFFNPETDCGGPAQWAWHLVLPWMVLALPLFAVYVRVLRAVRARLRAGEGERRLRVLKVSKLVGRDFGLALGLAAFAERLFGLPGLGNVMFEATYTRDLPVGEGILVAATALALSVQLAVDLVCGWLEPELRRP